MNALFQTDVNNMLIMPTFVLCHADQSPIDTITYVENFHFNNPENNPVEIMFSVRRMCNGSINEIYDKLEDFKLVFIPEWKRYYQIQVSVKDFEEGLVKDVIGKHLCEAELSQLMLYDIEINTENDILRDDYSLTIIYDPDNPKQSLLHRVLNDKGRNYKIKYVSPTLQKLVRSFSINGTSIDDFLRTTLSEEINCIVKYDSTDRSISLYDTLKICADCGHRGDYTGEKCPSCGGTSVYTEYGQDTGIFISTKNLAEEITVETSLDTVKTCFRIIGGDDKITTYVRAVNPNGSNYIYNFSNEMLADMSDELRGCIESYTELYEQLQPGYKELNQLIFENIDEQEYYKTSMMPKSEVNTTADDELNKLKGSVLGEIGVDSLSEKTPKKTVDNAVLGVARLEMAKGYNVEIVESTFTYTSEMASAWSGKFKVSHYSNEEDVATSDSNISLTVTNDYETYVKQKIDRELAKSDAHDIDTDWSLYSLDYLSSYHSAYESCLNVLTQLGVNDDDEHGKLCSELYDKYWAEWKEIEAEMAVREAKIAELEATQKEFEEIRNSINKQLDFEAYLGEKLFKEFFHYRRDDEYNNSNYISDGLTEADALRKAEELVEAASVQLYKASQTQYTISGTVANFLLMDEFKNLRSECELGNWIYIQTDDGDVYKLRLNGISGDYSSIEHLELTFSNAHNLTNPIYSLRDTILKANSMASSYQSVIHQASQGNAASQTLNDMRRLGLVAARYRIVNADNQTITIDEHGLLGREWDDLEGTYSPEQVKLVNNLMCYTDDGWKTVKQAIGKITYKDPETKKTVNKYGVIADTIIAADIYGSKFVGGDIYSENYWDVDDDELLGTVGTHINLNDGTFTIANGFLTFDGETLKITGDGTALDISSNQKIKDLDGNITNLNSSITQTASDIKLEVSKTYETKKHAEDTYATSETTKELSTRISQSAHSITMEATGTEDGSTESVGIKIQLYDEEGNKIETVDGNGNPTGSANITLTGLVKFTDLSGAGRETIINGDYIKTGKIKAEFLELPGIEIGNEEDDYPSIRALEITADKINADFIDGGVSIGAESISATESMSTPNLEVTYDLDIGSPLGAEIGTLTLNGINVGETLKSLQYQIDNIEISSGNCTCDVTALEARVNSLSGRVDSCVTMSEFNTLEDKLDDCITSSDLTGYVTKSDYASLTVVVQGLESDVSTLQTRVTTLENSGSGGSADLTGYAKITYVDGSISALSDEVHLRMDGIDEDITRLQTGVATIESNLSDWDLESRVTELESLCAEYESRLYLIERILADNGLQ